MKAQSKKIQSDVVLCLTNNLDSYSDIDATVRSGGKREVNKMDVYVVVVEVETNRTSTEEVSSFGGVIEQALVENGIDSTSFVVSNDSHRPNLFTVMVGANIQDEI